jgi:primosomal protein N''
MSKPNSFSADTLSASGASIAVPLPSYSLRERISDFIHHHRLKPQRIKALEYVVAALREKERMLRAKLNQASMAAEKRRLQKDLAIVERQRGKGQAMIDHWC